MFTGRIIKRAFHSGEKEEKKEKFCDSFQDLMEQQKTLGKKIRKAIKEEEPCVQMPDVVYTFVGKTGRIFALYRADPASQNTLESGKEIDAYGFERYLGEDNSSLIDLQKKEFFLLLILLFGQLLSLRFYRSQKLIYFFRCARLPYLNLH